MRYLLILFILIFTACQNSNKDSSVNENLEVKVTPMPDLPNASNPTKELQ